MNPPNIHIKVIIAEDQSIILHSLVILVKTFKNIEVIGTAANGKELLKLLEESRPDVILTDIQMPHLDGIEATRIINEKMPWIKVIALSMYDHPVYIKKLLKNGARGFVSKNASENELEKAISTVYNGDLYFSEGISKTLLREVSDQSVLNDNFNYNSLTSREIQIIELLADGFYTREIAEKLFVSNKTVERHKTNILKKLNLRNTAQLVKTALQKGIIIK
ncbi:MAG: response regulator transcription factor [Bacteroidales bacterium]|nr:response regulator transcription factor [Bacteroidales bacterium]